jgi:hypothetical protein
MVTDKPIKYAIRIELPCLRLFHVLRRPVPYGAMAVVPLAVPACALLFNSSRLPIRGQW